jgi:hypothetical protein
MWRGKTSFCFEKAQKSGGGKKKFFFEKEQKKGAKLEPVFHRHILVTVLS